MAAISNEANVPATQPGTEQSEPQRGGDSWLDRWRQRLGFRGASTMREDLEDALDESESDPADDFAPEERIMLRNILGLRELRVEDVMVQRADIEAVAADLSIADVLIEFEKAGHSRLPVFDETLDAPVGMVHIKDVVGYLTRGAMFTEDDVDGLALDRVEVTKKLADTDMIREILFVPASMRAGDLLISMRSSRIHLALVIDEHGGTDGLVTMEDLVEMIVGEIEDEHDEHEAPTIAREGPDRFVAEGRAPLDEVAALLGDDFDVSEAIEEVDTLGGLIVTLIGRVPEQGERVPGPGGWHFEVLEADLARVKRIRIERIPDASFDGDDGPDGPAVSDRRGETVAPA